MNNFKHNTPQGERIFITNQEMQAFIAGLICGAYKAQQPGKLTKVKVEKLKPFDPNKNILYGYVSPFESDTTIIADINREGHKSGIYFENMNDYNWNYWNENVAVTYQLQGFKYGVCGFELYVITYNSVESLSHPGYDNYGVTIDLNDITLEEFIADDLQIDRVVDRPDREVYRIRAISDHNQDISSLINIANVNLRYIETFYEDYPWNSYSIHVNRIMRLWYGYCAINGNRPYIYYYEGSKKKAYPIHEYKGFGYYPRLIRRTWHGEEPYIDDEIGLLSKTKYLESTSEIISNSYENEKKNKPILIPIGGNSDVKAETTANVKAKITASSSTTTMIVKAYANGQVVGEERIQLQSGENNIDQSFKLGENSTEPSYSEINYQVTFEDPITSGSYIETDGVFIETEGSVSKTDTSFPAEPFTNEKVEELEFSDDFDVFIESAPPVPQEIYEDAVDSSEFIDDYSVDVEIVPPEPQGINEDVVETLNSSDDYDVYVESAPSPVGPSVVVDGDNVDVSEPQEISDVIDIDI